MTGIGAAVAIGLAQAGAGLILASRRDDAGQTAAAGFQATPASDYVNGHIRAVDGWLVR